MRIKLELTISEDVSDFSSSDFFTFTHLFGTGPLGDFVLISNCLLLPDPCEFCLTGWEIEGILLLIVKELFWYPPES